MSVKQFASVRSVTEDVVDRILSQWSDVAPELDVSAMAVIGRVSRLSRLVDRQLAENFAEHGIDNWMYDVLATLRRTGPPFELSPGALVEQTMVTTGAMTNRVDRLIERGFVERSHSDIDRRRIDVRLTDAGREIVDTVAPRHYALESRLLESLTARQQETLAAALRSMLLDLGDTP